MARYPLFSVEQRGKSLHYSAQRRINCFAEARQEGDRSHLAFYGRPGLTLLADLGETPIRGMHPMGLVYYVAHRGTLYEVDNAGTATSVGTLNSVSGRVGMSDNGTQLIVVDGADGYTYTPGTTTFAVISDGDFLAADTVDFQAGRFCLNESDTGRFFLSASYDGTAYDATEFATAESFPDDIIRVFVDHSEIILFGSASTEVWGNVGATDFPYQRIAGAVCEWGLAARWSLVRYDNSIAYLAANRMGEVQVVRLMGYQPQRLSNEEVEYAINNYSSVSDATALAYMSSGHPFYQINFPVAGKSWLYDGMTGLWSELEYGTKGARHRAEMSIQFLAKTLVADYENGKIYRMDAEVYDDNGMSFAKELVGRHVFDEVPISVARMWLDLESGGGTATGEGDNPQAMLSVSKDGGRTWGPERWSAIGAIGRFMTRALWRRLGRAYDWTFRVRISDPIKTAISGVWLDAS